ncbi:MAG: hypothetical protein ABIN97_00115 [Ginsengibacter sp.]
MRERTPKRAMVIAFFVMALSFFNFSRLVGSECIRAIHIITLLTCGAAIGVFLTNLFILIRNNNK